MIRRLIAWLARRAGFELVDLKINPPLEIHVRDGDVIWFTTDLHVKREAMAAFECRMRELFAEKGAKVTAVLAPQIKVDRVVHMSPEHSLYASPRN